MLMHLIVLFSYKLWEAEQLDSLILINVVPGISVVVRSLGYF